MSDTSPQASTAGHGPNPVPDRLPKTHKAITEGGSALTRYQDVMVGSRSLWRLFLFELCSWASIVPGALGLALRSMLFKRILGSCGKGVVFGRNVSLLHPQRIHLGNRVVISDGCVLDARDPSTDNAISIGDDAILSHGVIISAKNAKIAVGDRCGLAMACVIQAVAGDDVTIEDDVVVGPMSYIAGGCNYNTARLDVPIAQQGSKPMGPTRVGPGCWLGSDVHILGGVTLGEHSIVGAGAVVTKPTDAFGVSGGVPAKKIGSRRPEDA
ncbi:MAG: acyltransferase [Geminicoccaceae bacterium]